MSKAWSLPSRNKCNTCDKSGIRMVLTNYRFAEKNNSHEMDVKKEQLFPVGGILASSEGWGRPCVEGAACAKLGNWEGSVPVGRGQGQGPRHMVLQRTSWGRVGREQGHAEESPERLLELPFHSSRGTSQRLQQIRFVFYTNRSYHEGNLAIYQES